MTKDEYNKFKSELEKIYKDKEFASSFKDILKSFSFKSSAKLLESKRDAYNYRVSKVFCNYDIPNKDLIAMLDKMWKEACEYSFNKIKNFFVTTVPVYTVKRMEMDILMKRYIDMTYKYCCDFAKDKIDK